MFSVVLLPPPFTPSSTCYGNESDLNEGVENEKLTEVDEAKGGKQLSGTN